jgi:hypothetical protein
MNNPEKLATLGTQVEDKPNKKHNPVCVGHHLRKQTQIAKIGHEPLYTQLKVKKTRTSFYAEIVADITKRN